MNLNCQYYEQQLCRSCDLAEYPQEQNLQAKQVQLQKAFGAEKVLAFQSSPEPIQYRSKVKLAWGNIRGHLALGVYDRFINFQELETCPIHVAGLNHVAQVCKELVEQFKIPIYDIKQRQGELKYLLLSGSPSTGEVLVRFVCRSDKYYDELLQIAQKLSVEIPRLRSVSLNIQHEHKAVFEGPEEVQLIGDGQIECTMNGVKILMPAQSFFQINHGVAEMLYKHARNFIQEHKLEKVLDLYCGAGGFLLNMAPVIKWGVGIEVSDASVHSARRSAVLNEFRHLEFVAADVDHGSHILGHRDGPHFEAILVNPPRRGLGASLIDQLNRHKAEYLIYSSCNIQSLKQDIQHLYQYELISVQGFDMFPWTGHFEVLAILQRTS